MKDVLLVIMMLAFFVGGYFLVGRVGKFVDSNYRAYRTPSLPEKKIYIAETAGRNVKTVMKEVNSTLETLPDCDEYEVLICRTADYSMIDYLKQTGHTIKYDSRE